MTPTSHKSFIAFLDEVDKVQKCVSTLSSLRSAILPWMYLDSIDETTKKIIKAFSDASASSPFDRVYQGLFISVHAGFEQFIRDLISDGINIINEQNKSSSAIGDKFGALISHHIVLSGRALSSYFEPREYYKFVYPEIIQTLTTNFNNSHPSKMSGSVFAQLVGNMNFKKIEDIFDKFNFKFNPTEFARVPQMSIVLKTSGVKETEKAIIDFINLMLTLRNRLAHSQGASSDITRDTLEKQIAFLRLLTPALSTNFITFLTS